MKVTAPSLHGIDHRIGHHHSQKAEHAHHNHLWRNVGIAFVGLLIIALIAGRLYLPVWVTDHVNNTLRLITGTGLGLLIPSVLLPAFHQTAWAEFDERSALDSWRSLGVLLLLGAGVVLLLLSENPLILYPLALLSAATVLAVLSVCYGLLAMLAVRGEGRARTWRDLWLPLAAGLFIALLQTAAVDWIRYQLTGTWNGFTL